MKLDLQNRQQVLLAVALAVVALWAGEKLLLTPLAKSWSARRAHIADLRKSISQGEQLLTRDETIRTRWAVMQTNTLPQEASLAESQVLKAFDRWSQDSRISVT